MRILISCACCVCFANAAIINVADYGDGSPSVANVASAIAAASDGDTISFPGGSATWGAGVTVSKAINLIGNGTSLTGSTPIANGFFYVTALTSAEPMRITGFTFTMSGVASGRGLVILNNVNISQLRVDNNTFINGSVQMEVGGSKGVVNNNTFRNGNSGIYFTAGSRAQADASWVSMAAGTADALFIEDNTFEINTEFLGANNNNQCIDTYNGGKLVIRYNSFIATNLPPTATDTFNAIQVHGNAAAGEAYGYWQKSSTVRRGQSVVEIYNNTMIAKRIDFMAKIRGSANLIYGNTLDTTAYNPSLALYEEEQYEVQFDPLRTAWPAEDQVHNTFFWNNTLRLNGTPNINYVSVAVGSTDYIQLGRDYWTNAPSATGGYEYFTGANGASGSHPTDGDPHPTEGTMVFEADGPNAYYGYTPYKYPHPLRGTRATATTANVGTILNQ